MQRKEQLCRSLHFKYLIGDISQLNSKCYFLLQHFLAGCNLQEKFFLAEDQRSVLHVLTKNATSFCLTRRIFQRSVLIFGSQKKKIHPVLRKTDINLILNLRFLLHLKRISASGSVSHYTFAYDHVLFSTRLMPFRQTGFNCSNEENLCLNSARRIAQDYGWAKKKASSLNQ